MKTVLGLDLGTQSLKAVFYDYLNKSIVHVASSPLEVDRDRHGKAEQRAEWWLAALEDCMRQVNTAVRGSVQAIGVSGQQHGFVPLGSKGEVLAPVKLWCDTSTQREVEEITERCGGADKAVALTGNPVLTGYTSPKILWLKKHLPDAYERLSHILLPHDYLNYALTGTLCMEYGDASGTGLLDVSKRSWSREMLNAVDPDRDLAACLPGLYDDDQFVGLTAGTVTPNRDSHLQTGQSPANGTVTDRFGLPAGIPVSTGGGDNMMGAIGTGNVSAGKLTISLGSSGTLYAHSDTPVIDPDGSIAAFCSSTGGWLPLLCTMNCTLSTELMRNAVTVPLEEFDAIAAKAPPGAQGLLTLPFFNGERTPNLPNATASIHGLTPSNCTREHLLRSTIEGTSFALKSGLDALSRLGLKADEIILTGGGAKSALWRQVIADLFQLPVVMHKHEEGASFGAALQALWVLQKQEDRTLSIDTVCETHLERDESRCTAPDPANIAIYQEAYARYQRVLSQNMPLLK